jgi:hypothetical protein
MIVGSHLTAPFWGDRPETMTHGTATWIPFGGPVMVLDQQRTDEVAKATHALCEFIRAPQ